MSTLHAPIGSASIRHDSLTSYLQAIATALAAQDASVERVLQAANAREIRLGGNSARFRAPDPRFRFASVDFASGAERRVEGVLLVCDDAGAPVTLAEVAPAFGQWKPGLPGTSSTDMHPVIFTTPYPPAAVAARPPRIATVVRVSLSADPATSGGRVREILLSRFYLDP